MKMKPKSQMFNFFNIFFIAAFSIFAFFVVCKTIFALQQTTVESDLKTTKCKLTKPHFV
jgi:hypothetical protein